MNKYSLQFLDDALESKYFEDQIPELIDFYKWICILGSMSALCVFIMEFISPFGFGIIKFLLLALPLTFLLTYHFIKRNPKYFNTILFLMNFGIGLMIDVLLILYINSDILFLAGQTVALVQFSLLIGTNVFANLSILLLNQIALVMINSFCQQYFKSLQLMFILAVILMTKSIWIHNKTKRLFFLSKYLQKNLFQNLTTKFELGIVKCRYDSRKRSIILINNNDETQKYFQDQNQFLKFIREYKQIPSSSQSIVLKQQNLILTQQKSLELIIFDEFQRNNEVNSFYHVYSKKDDLSFKIGFVSTYQNKQKQIILIFQKDYLMQKIVKLKTRLKKQKLIIEEVLEINDLCRKGLGYLKAIQNHLNGYNEYLGHPLHYFFNATYRNYNIIISNNFQKLGQVRTFKIEQLFLDLKNCLLKTLQANSSQIEVQYKEPYLITTNYLLLTQLIINLILVNLKYFSHIYIQFSEVEILDQACIKVDISFVYFKTQTTQQQNQISEMPNLPFTDRTSYFQYVKSINQKILKSIGINKEIYYSYLNQQMQIQFTIVKDLKMFFKQF